MQRFYYERTSYGAFHVLDRLRGSTGRGGEIRHLAECDNRGDAERIVNALNAAEVKS